MIVTPCCKGKKNFCIYQPNLMIILERNNYSAKAVELEIYPNKCHICPILKTYCHSQMYLYC